MKLTMLAKDGRSKDKACPSVYLADTGDLVVQGVRLDASEMNELQNPLPGETAVRISAEVVLQAVERYKESGPR